MIVWKKVLLKNFKMSGNWINLILVDTIYIKSIVDVHYQMILWDPKVCGHIYLEEANLYVSVRLCIYLDVGIDWFILLLYVRENVCFVCVCYVCLSTRLCCHNDDVTWLLLCMCFFVCRCVGAFVCLLHLSLCWRRESLRMVAASSRLNLTHISCKCKQ